ncbi:MAG: hypothetical protein [Wendovervirus sonii]|uniref:Uncharacterized protein n=1 Tax=phage Lak_Megaphage_Sonny TaxID=3109229 RepID=A0ABZ0Z3E2_9CAUD|nr:MAG: hypothetical protein [phage Lak_Megaphage_Sonny]
MIEVVVKKKLNGKLSYFITHENLNYILSNRFSFETAYIADSAKPDKIYKISNILPTGCILYTRQSIDIFRTSNGKTYRSIPKEGQSLLIFKDLIEHENYLKTYNTEMDNQKNNFENFAKSLMNAVNDFSSCFDEKHSALDLLAEMLEGKNDCKCNCKHDEKSNANTKQNHCKCNTSCAFSLSIGNNGVHVYRTNDKFYINDVEVSEEDYNNAVDVLGNTGNMQVKIDSIKDILENSTKNSEMNKRIAELEARILEAQKEIESLRRK